ncbi:MAG: hypothetical protein WCH01_21145, partial [Methylococcaceae bacterium]
YYGDNLSTRLNAIVDIISDDRKLRVYSLRSNFKTSIDDKLANAAVDVLDGYSDEVGRLFRRKSAGHSDEVGHPLRGCAAGRKIRFSHGFDCVNL